MATIKLKRSETASSVPTTSDIAVGEVAVNTADQKIFTRDSNDNIVTIANFAISDPNLVFPTGDYGDLTNPDEDAFGVIIESYFDCLSTPTGTLATQDLGGLS